LCPAPAAADLDGVSNKEIMELLLVTQYFDMVGGREEGGWVQG
jgi:hypothetical protein